MEKTIEKKCPNCDSQDIIDTGDKVFDDYPPNPLPSKPTIYKCSKCGKNFVMK